MKKHHIIFNDLAYLKLKNISFYIAFESPQVARDIVVGIQQLIDSLELMPERFSSIPEKISYKSYQVRHCFYKRSFRIIYVIEKDIVRILDIRHSAQNSISTTNLIH